MVVTSLGMNLLNLYYRTFNAKYIYILFKIEDSMIFRAARMTTKFPTRSFGTGSNFFFLFFFYSTVHACLCYLTREGERGRALTRFDF